MRAAKVRLNIQVQCDTFPEALRALQTGEYATILPQIAAGEVDTERYVQVPIPWFRKLDHPVVLAWNPRLPKIREGLAKLIPALVTTLKFEI